MKALKMPLTHHNSSYKRKSVQIGSFIDCTLMFLVLKACLMQMGFFVLFCFVALQVYRVCVCVRVRACYQILLCSTPLHYLL